MVRSPFSFAAHLSVLRKSAGSVSFSRTRQQTIVIESVELSYFTISANTVQAKNFALFAETAVIIRHCQYW